MEMQQWISEVNEKKRNMEERPIIRISREGAIIYKVPAFFRNEESNDDDNFLYRPYKVSFGPYHHGNELCRPSEQDKELALLRFLDVTEKPLESYIGALSEVVQDLKDAYDELDPFWQENTQEFLKMMILDGCFLIQILQLKYSISPVLLNYPSEIDHHYRHDIMLLENQVPVLLLDKLLLDGFGSSHGLLKDAISILFSLPDENISNISGSELHILDAYGKSLAANQDHHFTYNFFRILESFIGKMKYRFSGRERRQRYHFDIPSATELHKVGIGFATSGTVSFQGKTLRLPQILVDASIESRFLNIIAFELMSRDSPLFTSYLGLMRSLVQGVDDVRLLQLRGIMYGGLPPDDVAQLFYMFSKNTVADRMMSAGGYKYSEVAERLRQRFDKMSNEWRADLFKNYLKSPWTIISVIAAVLLFTLTAIQTVYTVLGYVNRK